MFEKDLPTVEDPPFRALIVDDNIGSAKILGMLFEKIGPYDVELAHCGRDAIEKAREFRPDVMVLDLMRWPERFSRSRHSMARSSSH